MRSIKNNKVNNSHINFARNCMIELITKNEFSSEYPEITSRYLNKIDEILNRYRRR